MATYTTNCVDAEGRLLCQPRPVGESKNRIFNPDNDPRFLTSIKMPSEITAYAPSVDVTFLRYGDLYSLKKADVEAAQKMEKAFGVHQPKEVPKILFDTMVVEVAAHTRDGDVIGSRYFGGMSGKDSEYNRTGVPEHSKSPDEALFGTVMIGLQTVQKIVKARPYITKVIFKTSSDFLIDTANNLEQYLKNGLPEGLSHGLIGDSLQLLKLNIDNTEACNNGIQVMFWKVSQAFLPGAIFDINCRFDDLNNVPLPDHARSQCQCFNCITAEQHREFTFAKVGQATLCPCPKCDKFLDKHKHLKKGDIMLLTNNAGVDKYITMEVDP